MSPSKQLVSSAIVDIVRNTHLPPRQLPSDPSQLLKEATVVGDMTAEEANKAMNAIVAPTTTSSSEDEDEDGILPDLSTLRAQQRENASLRKGVSMRDDSSGVGDAAAEFKARKQAAMDKVGVGNNGCFLFG